MINWEAAGECLKMISHPNRLQIIHLLLKRDYSVGELAQLLKIPQNVCSEHLNLMKHKQLLTSRREGRKIFYGLNEPALSSIMACIEKRFTQSD